MKHTIRLLMIIVIILISVKSKSQSNKPSKIYFLADTTTTSKENRYFEISAEGNFSSGYSFYCKCAPPYFSYPTFVYRSDRVKPKYSDVKPDVKYISWKELSDSLHKYGNNFPEYFKLIIVEKLPTGNYKTIEELRYVHQNAEKVQ